MKKRILSLFLTLALLVALVPFAATPAQAAERREIYGELDLKRALEADGDANIVIMNDIVASASISELGSTFITLGRGKKTLDLAGHKVEVNATGAGRFTFIRIPKGADFTVMDSSEKETGKLWADGDMVFRDYSGLPYYYNADVRYRDTIIVDGGSFTLESGEIEAGRAKEIWVYSGMKVEKWFQQLNYALQGGALAWAIGVRFDGNAYQIVNGDAITLNSGSVTINGGKVTGKGYRDMATEFNSNEFQVYFKGAQNNGTPARCAALHAVSGDLTINGGQIYGMANANALDIASSVNITLNSGIFKTQLLRKIVLPNFGNGGAGNYKTDQFVADSNDYEDKGDHMHMYCGGAGNLGVSVDYLDGNFFVWLDENPVDKAQWSNSKFKNTAYSGGHTLRVSRTSVDSDFATVTLPLTEPTAITAVDLTGTMAKGMTLTQDAIKSSNPNVSVTTTWYRDSQLITGTHEVGFGGYLAKVEVRANKGYRLTNTTKYTILGDTPTLVQHTSDGSYAIVWSQPYIFKCDHSYNADWSLLYDEAGHYQRCTVCGEKIGYEKHTYSSGAALGNTTTYNCTVCDHSYTAENGRVKLNGVVVNIPVAVAGDAIPTPVISEEFSDMVSVTSWDFTKSSTGATVNPGDVYESGESYTFTVRAKAKDGYYFDSRAKMNCAAVATGTNTVDDDVIITTYKIYAYSRSVAYVTLPSMTGTMGDFIREIAATVNGKETNNMQITIKTHGKDDEVYVRKTLSGGWQLVRGAASLDAFWQTPIVPDTAYDFSFDFSTNSTYVSDENIYYYSPASYAGLTLKGGNVWFSVNGVVVSDSNKVSDITVVSVMPPFAGNAPENDFDVLNTAALSPVSGKWDVTGRFDYDTAYTFTATVKLKDGFVFDSAVNASVNFAKASVSVSGNTATVTYTFPATEMEVKAGNPFSDVANPFSDVVEKSYYYNAVLWAVSHEPQITVGTSATTFSPSAGCTRAQVVTFLWRAAGSPKPTGTSNPFTDVKEGAYYYKAVLWAVENKITAGTSATTFSPNTTCTRAQIVTFLWRYEGSLAPNTTSNPFKDVKSGAYYEKAVLWASETGVTAGTGKTTFSPDATCTRAQVVTFLYRDTAK